VRKAAFFIGLFIAGVLIGYLAAGGIGSCVNAGRNSAGGGIDTAGIGRAGAIARDAGQRVDRATEALTGSRDRVDNSRDLVTGSLPVVGEIGSGLDTITGGLEEAQGRIRRITASSLRIERTIEALRAGEEVLDDSSD